MSNSQEQRANEREEQLRTEGDSGSALVQTRAQTDRLLAAAAKSFDSLRQGDSDEFLRRSRQTGGQ